MNISWVVLCRLVFLLGNWWSVTLYAFSFWVNFFFLNIQSDEVRAHVEEVLQRGEQMLHQPMEKNKKEQLWFGLLLLRTAFQRIKVLSWGCYEVGENGAIRRCSNWWNHCRKWVKLKSVQVDAHFFSDTPSLRLMAEGPVKNIFLKDDFPSPAADWPGTVLISICGHHHGSPRSWRACPGSPGSIGNWHRLHAKSSGKAFGMQQRRWKGWFRVFQTMMFLCLFSVNYSFFML